MKNNCLHYFTKEQQDAINKKIPMTQRIFNEIQNRRMEVGEELEEFTIEVFLQYDEFAANYVKEIQQFLDAIKDLDEADIDDEFTRKWSV